MRLCAALIILGEGHRLDPDAWPFWRFFALRRGGPRSRCRRRPRSAASAPLPAPRSRASDEFDSPISILFRAACGLRFAPEKGA